jgi:hypothetical protein
MHLLHAVGAIPALCPLPTVCCRPLAVASGKLVLLCLPLCCYAPPLLPLGLHLLQRWCGPALGVIKGAPYQLAYVGVRLQHSTQPFSSSRGCRDCKLSFSVSVPDGSSLLSTSEHTYIGRSWPWHTCKPA